MDAETKPIKSELTLILPAPPSAIEKSSVAPTAFIVGTYSLDTAEDSDNAASRSGSLCVVALSTPEPKDYAIHHSYSTASAVLDISIDPRTCEIAVANSTGGLEIWQETADSTDPNIPILTHSHTVQAFPSSTLVLALHQHPHKERSRLFAVSLSDGSLAVVDTSPSAPTSILWHQPAHSLEAWTVRWLSWISPGRELGGALASGGDDSALIHTDIPYEVLPLDLAQQSLKPQAIAGDDDEDALELRPPRPSGINKRIHQAGVTAVLPLGYEPSSPETSSCGTDPRFQDFFLTGSYDDCIRVVRCDRKPAEFGLQPKFVCLAELNLGGGVWRLSLIGNGEAATIKEDVSGSPERTFHVLASCMYAGCRVVAVSVQDVNVLMESAEGGGWNLKVLARFEEHESMNYASATVQKAERWAANDGLVLQDMSIVSTSFYDRRFCVWTLPGL